MANIKQIKSEALSTIDAAMAIVNKYPDLGEANTDLSFDTSTNPFTLFMDLFKKTEGYDKLISVIAKYISYELPILEEAVKGILITKLKDIISCSVNPFFTQEILRNGIVFNVEEIDISDVLKYSPFDEQVGKYFYFGTDEAEFPEDLTRCDDMDAFIWFMINKANKRYVWKPKKNRQDEEFREDYPTDSEEKLKKEDGIITFEYYERSQNLRDAYGENYALQVPYNNCLHVFIGDVREKKTRLIDSLQAKELDLYKKDKEIKTTIDKLEIKKYEIKLLEDEKILLEEKLANNEIDEKEYKKTYKKINNKIKNKQREIDLLTDLQQIAYGVKQRFQYEIGDIKAQLEKSFPFLNPNKNRNYYYGKSLIEFNIDYIMSLTFFEEKSLTARLLDALTSLLTIDLHLSYKQQLIKNEVKKMVTMINESDDLVISDCFFTFSNDDYDAMTRQAELKKAGLITIDGNETSAVKVDAKEILAKLNEINDKTTKETIQSVIEGTITDITKELSNTEYEQKDKVNFGVQMNILENLLNSLAYVIVRSVLSPKVYLLLLINLRIIGRETNFNLEGFIGQYKQLIADLIRSIRDQILDYLMREIMIIIGDLVTEVTLKLSIEQARYYSRLISKLVSCFKKHGRNLDFNIDNVDYADILQTEEEPKNNEC